MLNLDSTLTLDKDTIESPNLTDKFLAEDLIKIGNLVFDGYTRDKMSRAKWENRTAAAMDLAMQIQKDKNFPWPNCYTLDTEVLTNRGWQFIDTVKVGDAVYSRDALGVAGFFPVVNTVKHLANKLVHFQGKSIDLLVTPEHNMVLEGFRNKQQFIKAGDFVGRNITGRYIPLTSINLNIGPATFHGIPAKAYLRFLGWYISEGCRFYSQVAKSQLGFFGTIGSSFSLAQSLQANSVKYAIMRSDIQACGFTFSENESGFIVHTKSMPESLVEELQSLGQSNTKKIPRVVFKAAASDLEELLSTLVLGDGTISKKNGHQSYFTTSKELADNVQELCQFIGLRGTITIREPGAESVIRDNLVVSKLTGYTVSINMKDRIKVDRLTRGFVDYDGEVACVETAPHHTLYVRRKGKALWCGNCSNIAFPLITIAVTQFHARAYPAIINGPELVKYKVFGSDPEGKEKQRAERVGMHMSWQLMEQDTDWESQHDRLLINLAVIGSAFKKSYPSGTLGYNESELVMARDLVLDYYTQDVENCPRKTHVIPMFRNEIYERVKRKTFRDILEEAWYKQPPAQVSSQQQANRDNRAGTNPPPQGDETTPFVFLEQHTWLDLDKDGYAEPYIITLEQSSKTVVRIVTRFEQEADITKNSEGEVIKIRATEYFTKYTFIPSPDGGVYDMGFGILLGPLNESVNSLINQLTDAGTMSVAAGGFLGRGAKIRGGVYTFAPFGWQRVDSTGEDLHKNIFPLPVREPSSVLFNLLSLLIQYTNRISGSTDIMVGESVGQNTPADTARQMQQEGQKIYNAIFKRIWNSMKEEFRKLYILNAYNMPDKMSFGMDGKEVSRSDYLGDPTRIAPVADPNTSTQADRVAQATMLKQAAMSTPGYNVPEVERMYLKALNIPNVDVLYNPEKFPPGEDLKIKLKKMDLQMEQMRLTAQQQEHVRELQLEYQLNMAKINEMEAHAMQMAAGIEGEQAARQLEHFKAMVELIKSRNDVLQQQIQHHTKKIETVTKMMELENAARESGQNANGNGVGGMADSSMQQEAA